MKIYLANHNYKPSCDCSICSYYRRQIVKELQKKVERRNKQIRSLRAYIKKITDAAIGTGQQDDAERFMQVAEVLGLKE